MRVFTNLTPFIPLSFKGEGEEIYREGFTPLLPTLPLPLLREGVRGWVAKQPPESRCFPLLAERELGCPGFNIIPRSISRANMAGGS